jgi:hypothetical protein
VGYAGETGGEVMSERIKILGTCDSCMNERSLTFVPGTNNYHCEECLTEATG